MIDFIDVSKTYPNGTHALHNINIHIDKGDFAFIVGASGAGKSTFLKLIMHEETPSSGEIIINGIKTSKLKRKQVPFLRRHMGIVFQDFRLIEKMNVFDNVAFAMRAVGENTATINKRVPYVLELVGLKHKMKSKPSELSGGEQQRVSLARALVNNPEIIIADEPTGNVDPEMSHEIIELLNEINAKGTTVIIVTHEHDLVREFNRRVITINQGRVINDTGNNEFASYSSGIADPDSENTYKSMLIDTNYEGKDDFESQSYESISLPDIDKNSKAERLNFSELDNTKKRPLIDDALLNDINLSEIDDTKYDGVDFSFSDDTGYDDIDISTKYDNIDF